jgi:hypothetical protein
VLKERKRIKIRELLFQISISKYFNHFINFSIVLNTIVLALDRYPLGSKEQGIYESINIGFYAIFVFEMLIKLVGLGPKGYVRDKFNIFDCIIVFLSSIDLILSLSQLNKPAEGNNSISAFRAFRLLRIFKLVKSWKKFQELLLTIIRSLKDISNFGILLLLFIFIYTLLGMELFAHTVLLNEFGNLVEEGGTSPKSNFDSFFNAFITVFIILTGEDWNNIYYSYARDNYFVSTVFFYSLIVFGQLVLLNLFLAILLDNFDEVEEEERKRRNKKKIIETKKKLHGAITLKILNLFMESRKPELQDAQEKVKNQSSKSLDKFHLPEIKRKRVKSKFKQKESDPFDSLNDIDMSREQLIDSHVGTVKRLEENKETKLVTKKQSESNLGTIFDAPNRLSIKSILKPSEMKKHKSTKNLPKLNFK